MMFGVLTIWVISKCSKGEGYHSFVLFELQPRANRHQLMPRQHQLLGKPGLMHSARSDEQEIEVIAKDETWNLSAHLSDVEPTCHGLCCNHGGLGEEAACLRRRISFDYKPSQIATWNLGQLDWTPAGPDFPIHWIERCALHSHTDLYGFGICAL